MRKRYLWLLGLLLCCGSVSAENTELQAVNTANDKAVTRVTFDREVATIVYADGTEETVDEARIVLAEKPSGIDAVKTDDTANAPRVIYDMQGRQVSEKNLAPGIYVERRGDKTVKFIKK